MFVCTHILTIWTQVFYLNQTMGQQWPEVRPQDVGLALGVVVDVARGQLFVKRQIPGCGGGLDAKPRDQVLTAYLPDEAHAQLHEREPVALWLG